MIDIKYQVVGQDGNNIESDEMTPHESGIFFTGGTFDNNIGPVPGYPTSSEKTAVDGTFHDVPVGVCSPVPISNPGVTATQNIKMIGPSGTLYLVRSQTFTAKAPGAISFGHGSITNSLGDISGTR